MPAHCCCSCCCWRQLACMAGAQWPAAAVRAADIAQWLHPCSCSRRMRVLQERDTASGVRAPTTVLRTKVHSVAALRYCTDTVNSSTTSKGCVVQQAQSCCCRCLSVSAVMLWLSRPSQLLGVSCYHHHLHPLCCGTCGNSSNSCAAAAIELGE
jgi:hypothetical protein